MLGADIVLRGTCATRAFEKFGLTNLLPTRVDFFKTPSVSSLLNQAHAGDLLTDCSSPPISSPAGPSQPISSPEPFVAVLLAGELVTPSPHKVVAGEADDCGKFGQAEGSVYFLDPDIYTDDRISVQSIDAPLLIRSGPLTANLLVGEPFTLNFYMCTVKNHEEQMEAMHNSCEAKLFGIQSQLDQVTFMLLRFSGSFNNPIAGLAHFGSNIHQVNPSSSNDEMDML